MQKDFPFLIVSAIISSSDMNCLMRVTKTLGVFSADLILAFSI